MDITVLFTFKGEANNPPHSHTTSQLNLPMIYGISRKQAVYRFDERGGGGGRRVRGLLLGREGTKVELKPYPRQAGVKGSVCLHDCMVIHLCNHLLIDWGVLCFSMNFI